MQSQFPLRRCYLYYSVDNRLSKSNIRVFLQTIIEEFEQHICFLRESMIQEGRRLYSLYFEVQSQVRQIETNLLEQLLNTVLVAGL
jgi:hypothetical protein